MTDQPIIGASTRPVVLLGHPVGHSQSPRLHNAVFGRAGLDLVYLACDVPPARLGDAVAGLRGLNALGANVTIPHKQAIVGLLDDVSDEARALGAVNTITNQQGRLTGHNTDVGGFLDGLGEHTSRVPGSEVLVWGAGGAASAVVYALLSLRPSRLTLVARRPEQAQALAETMSAYDAEGVLSVARADEIEEAVLAVSLCVNTTPLGMSPYYADQTPWPLARFRPGQVIYDLVYTPERTRLLRDAEAAGATPIGGMPMLRGQAARAFGLWTGQKALY